MQHKLVRITLAVLEGFGALTAIAGGIVLMLGEIQFPLAWLQVIYFVLGLAISGLATSLWWAEYRGHSFLTGHVSHA